MSVSEVVQVGETKMYELDHMLNGKQSRNHLQEMVNQAKLEKLAHEAQVAQVDNREQNHKVNAPRRMDAP